MNLEARRRASSLRRHRVAFIALLAWAAAGCAVEVSLVGKRCNEAHRCESGFVCRDSVCVAPGEPSVDAGAHVDAGAGDAGRDTGADGGDVDAGSDPGADGGGDAGPEEILFVDDDGAGFGLGDGSLGASFHPDAGALVLDADVDTGVFLSRVFDAQSAGHAVALRWTPRAPYGKPIPGAVGDDAEALAYEEGGADLDGLVCLLHADGPRGDTLPDGAVVPDDGPNAHPASLVDLDVPDDSRYIEGMLQEAIFLERDDYLRLTDSDTSPEFAFGDGAFTFSGWAKIPGCAPSDDNVILLGGEIPHIWLGALCPEGVAHFQVRDDVGAGGGAASAGPIIVDDRWHHLAGVKRNSPEDSRLFVDGELHATRADDWGAFSNFTKELFIGEFPIGTFPSYAYSSTLAFDDLAVFKRALDDDEVRALYLRGALHARLQVRACPTADCAGVAFVGPDGSAASFFAEPTLGALPAVPAPAATPPLTGRYFQYRVLLSSTAAAKTPAITRVELSIARP